MNKVNFKPSENRVLIIANKPADKTESGLAIPTSAQDRIDEGVVAVVGSEVDDNLIEGTRVKYALGTGSPIQIDGVEYLILKEDEILGFFTEV